MNVSFYNVVSGLIAYEGALEQVAHNISNTNTVGYKALRPEFTDLLYTEMYTNEVKPQVGHGVRLRSADLMYGQGPLQQTWNALDYAIIGDGFFAVQAQDGTIEYTRNGVFDISVEGSAGYLVDSMGRYVLDASEQKIPLERNENGTFKLDGLADKFGIFRFDNPYELLNVNGTSFRKTERSGEPVLNTDVLIREQALEGSGVHLADEMTNLIVTQRAYQLSARVVQTADQLEEIANNLR